MISCSQTRGLCKEMREKTDKLTDMKQTNKQTDSTIFMHNKHTARAYSSNV